MAYFIDHICRVSIIDAVVCAEYVSLRIKGSSRLAVMGMKYTTDLAVRLAIFYLKVVGFWFADNRSQQLFRCITVIYTIVMSVFALWIQSMGIYYCWGDFTMCTYILVNILGIAISLVKLCLLLVQKEKFLRLIEFMRRHFWHSDYSQKEIKIFAGTKRICIYFVCSFSFISQLTVVLYSIRPLLLNIGKNESERVLLFHMWLDLPLSTSPYFEIMYVLQVLSLYQCDVGFICFDNIFCIMCLHSAGQFRILQYKLRNIHQLASKLEETSSSSASDFSYNCFVVFKDCIRQHQIIIAFCKLFEEVFRVIVLFQVIMFSMLVCLVGYQIFLVDLNVPMRISLTSYIISNLCQLWVFTYSCDTMTRESLSVATAMYAAPWPQLPTDKYGKMIRKDLQIVIMRSRRGCHITACGFFSISLETYTRIMSTAMSYFTLLKGTTEDANT